MKTRLTLLKLAILLCCSSATTAAIGRTIWWIGVPGTQWGTNFGVRTNWATLTSSNNLPSSGDICQFNGSAPGSPVIAASQDGHDHTGFGIGGDPGAGGLTIEVSSDQTAPVQIVSAAAFPPAIALTGITVDAGSGQLILGDNTANVLVTVERPAGTVHDFINNSTNPVIICPNVMWQNGGGAQMTLEFDSPTATSGSGIGDYGITNSFSSGSGSIAVWFVSSGVITWNGPSIAAVLNGIPVSIASPVFLNYGTTLILKTNNLLTTQAIQNNNPGPYGACPLVYDGNSTNTLSGIIGGGTSPLISITVKSGTLTLAGANLFTGDITNLGGELIAGKAEAAGTSGPLGQGGTIHFFGGTLGWSLNNSFDYSSRFDTANGQQYNFDTTNQSVTLGTGLGGNNTLTKFGNGTLTLGGTNTYSGLTTVSAGKLAFQGSKTGTGSITVNNGAALGVNAAAGQVTPGTLTVGSVSGATLGFDAIASTTTAPLQPTTLSSAGTITFNANSGTFTVGSEYPLLKWTTGPVPTIQLGILNNFSGYVTNDPANTVSLVITGTAYTWTGLNNNSWDLATDRKQLATKRRPGDFWQRHPGLFDNSALVNLNITNKGVVQPLAITVNNNTNVYQITSSPGNGIGGSAAVNKLGTNSLSLNGGNNTYTGVTTLSGGITTVSALANGGSASDLGAATAGATNLVLDGGTLQYTNGTAQIDRLFTVTTGGGTIDASGVGSLQFTNTGAIAAPGSGARTLILTGSAATNNTMAPVIADSTGGGATALTKNGTGEWDLTGNNTYSGLTTVNNGVLRIGQATASGSLGGGNATLAGGTALLFNRTNSLTYGGAINGGGAVVVQAGTVTLTSGSHNYSGGTSISNGATLNFNGGNAGQLAIQSAPIINNGKVVFNSVNAFTIRGFAANISGTGNFEIGGTGVVAFDGAKLYTGWTLIDAGATLQVSVGNETLGMATSVITNNGTLFMMRQDNGVFILTNNIVGTGKVVKDDNNQNVGDITLYGTNTYTGGTIIGAGEIILGDGVTAGSGSIVGNVIFTNSPAGQDGYRQLEFNRPDSFTFPGNIIGTNNFSFAGDRGVVLQNGTGVLTLTGTNSWVDGTIVSNGVIQVGNGGTTGSISTNTLKVGTMIVFNRSDAITFPGNINGTTGVVVQAGSGTLTLAGQVNLTDTNVVPNNSGGVTVSNGTMLVASSYVYGNVKVSGGAFAAPAIGTVGTLTVSNNMTILSGTVLSTVNKSLTQSNSVYLVAGNLTAAGGTLKLVNYGPAFVPGDRFVIFRQVDGVTPRAVTGGGTMTVVAPGVTSFINNLAVDGSVTVQSVTATPMAFTSAVQSGGNISLTWPSVWTGVHLQSQTNTLATGLGTNWVTMLGSDATNSYSAPIVNNTNNQSVFYRLAP